MYSYLCTQLHFQVFQGLDDRDFKTRLAERDGKINKEGCRDRRRGKKEKQGNKAKRKDRKMSKFFR